MSDKTLEHVWFRFPILAALEEEQKHLRIHRTQVDTELFPGWIFYEWGFYECLNIFSRESLYVPAWTRPHYIVILLPQLPECWDFRREPSMLPYDCYYTILSVNKTANTWEWDFCRI